MVETRDPGCTAVRAKKNLTAYMPWIREHKFWVEKFMALGWTRLFTLSEEFRHAFCDDLNYLVALHIVLLAYYQRDVKEMTLNKIASTCSRVVQIELQQTDLINDHPSHNKPSTRSAEKWLQSPARDVEFVLHRLTCRLTNSFFK
jgi:hypothetical protein